MAFGVVESCNHNLVFTLPETNILVAPKKGLLVSFRGCTDIFSWDITWALNLFVQVG